MTSIEALLQVPGTQLQHIESTLRQLLSDLKKAGITPPAELDDLIEEAAIAHAEEMAMLKDCIGPEEDDYYDIQYYEMYGAYPEDSISAFNQLMIDCPEKFKPQDIDNELPF